MRVEVNGIRLFFDVEGAKLVPDGPIMREKPTLLLLHGGPGMDHSPLKLVFSRYAEICQVVYLDQRANGRSEGGPRERWNLEQFADDVHEFCRALDIDQPILLGQSFGGIVAMAYATRHPEHPGKLILSSTTARTTPERQLAVFERLGGALARETARRVYVEGDAAALSDWVRYCAPLISSRPRDPDIGRRMVQRSDVAEHFLRRDGEFQRMNLLPELAKIQCPTLILGGDDDPFTPIENQVEIAAAIPEHLVRFERYPLARHGVWADDPSVFDVIEEFIRS